MCGVLAILEIKSDPHALRKLSLQMAKKLRHRGPDWSGIYADEQVIIAHERLAIVDIKRGAQPLRSDSGAILSVNGEIYNHLALRKKLTKNPAFKTKSDCEIILHLYEEMGTDFLSSLNGIFAFVLYDKRRNSYLIARDPIGVMPLYTGRDKEGNFYVASEMKALVGICNVISEFPPAHYLLDGQLRCYFQHDWYKGKIVADSKDMEDRLRVGLEQAVRRQLMCDVPFGLLLSGGLDSSLVAAIVAKFAAVRVEDGGKSMVAASAFICYWFAGCS